MTLIAIFILVVGAGVIGLAALLSSARALPKERPRARSLRREWQKLPRHISWRDIQSGKIHIPWKKVKVP